MDPASIGRKRAVRTNQHIGRLLLQVSLCLAALSLVWTFPKSVSATESASTTTVLVYNHAHVSPGILSSSVFAIRPILASVYSTMQSVLL
jgi:hypothetical protein